MQSRWSRPRLSAKSSPNEPAKKASPKLSLTGPVINIMAGLNPLRMALALAGWSSRRLMSNTTSTPGAGSPNRGGGGGRGGPGGGRGGGYRGGPGGGRGGPGGGRGGPGGGRGGPGGPGGNRGGPGGPGGRGDSRRSEGSGPDDKFEDGGVGIARVSKVGKGGRHFSFRALVVVGDGLGMVGMGMGRAREVTEAIRKGVDQARKKMVKVNVAGSTIPHEIIAKFGAAKVMLKPAS